ncbi:MAG: S1C family serine protease [Trueperaceae bacterium]
MKRLTLLFLLFPLMACNLFRESSSQTALTFTQAQTETALTNEQLALIDAAGLDFEEKRVIDVYNRVSPSVVSIITQVVQYDFFFDPYTQEGAGSGFVLDDSGHILTNYHVIEDAEGIEVTFSDETTLTAELVGIDPRNDIAVIKVEPTQALQPVELGESKTLQVGQRTIAIGNPFGEFSRSLTTGVVSALNRTIEGPEGLTISGMIQTDAAINRGNSGGPLLDSMGRVIGINSAIFSPSGTSAGVGFAVPVDTVKRVLPDLLELGRYRHPWLGIRGAYTLTERLAEALELPVPRGLLLVDIADPLASAGVQGATREAVLGNRRIYLGGDVLTKIDGRDIDDYDDVRIYLEENYKVGDVVTVTVQRGNEARDIEVTLVEEPSS